MLVYKATFWGIDECCYGKNTITKIEYRLKSICVVQIKNFKFFDFVYEKHFNMDNWVNSDWFIFEETPC